MWLLTLPQAGDGPHLIAAEQSASALEPQARDPLGLQVLGMITLTASLLAAAIQRTDSAGHWLDEAAGVASRVADEPMRTWMSFSSANVSIWRVTVGVERVKRAAQCWNERRPSTSTCSSRSHPGGPVSFDVGRGLAREPRTRAEAVSWLRKAEDTAPQRFRNSTAVRETVAYLLNRATAAAGGRELRGMAARIGLPH